MFKVDVKIMAVKPRRGMVLKMCEQLGLSEAECVVYDDRPQGGGPQYTRKKCWFEPIPEGVTHRLVLQDDVELCDNFIETMNRIVNTHPDFIFTLYCPRVKWEHALPNSPYVVIKGRNAWGPGIMMPVYMIKPLYEFMDRELCPDFPRDDGIYSWYAEVEKIHIATTIPSTIQHLCPKDSTIGFNDGRKVSKVWRGRDLSDVNWEAKDVTFSPSMPMEVSLEQIKQRLDRLMSKPVYTVFRDNNGNVFKEEDDAK